MATVQARSKTITLIAAVAKNGVIGHAGGIPWHLPEDFRHFKRSTVNQTVLMGRATFESIGRPLPERETIVLTRDRVWRKPGVHIAHDVQSAIDMAEDLPGALMVVGGSHIYASTMSVAHMQIISEVDAYPDGDTFYPPWDRSEWEAGETMAYEGFKVSSWHRLPREERTWQFAFRSESARAWWNRDWSTHLERAVAAQRQKAGATQAINWQAVHQAAMRVIIEAAEDYARHGPSSSPKTARQVRLSRHLSMADVNAIQGALLHWSDYLAPRPHGR